MNPTHTYQSTLSFRRTPEEKADPLLSWIREDRRFFAAGACHILAYALLELHADGSNQIILLRPTDNYSGSHVYVSNKTWAFDFNGWTREKELLDVTEREYREIFPGWGYERIVITDPLNRFCAAYNHQLPENYHADVWARAFAYIKKFPFTSI